MIDLNEIFKFSEKVNVEVNAAQGGIPNSIWETYSSFANTFGGNVRTTKRKTPRPWASLFPPTIYPALRSHSCVALSSVTTTALL